MKSELIYKKLFNALIFVFLILSVLIRIPYYEIIKFPMIHNGTIIYTTNAIDFLNNNFSSIGEFPIGLPMFQYLLIELFGNLSPQIVIQNFLSIFTGFSIIYVFNKYFTKKIAILSIIVAIIIVNQSISLNYDFSHDIESIYKNLVILSFILTINIIKSNKVKWVEWIAFAIVLLFIGLLRSNGPFFYAEIIFIFLFKWINKEKTINNFKYLLPFIFLNLLWCSFNLKHTGVFMIGDTSRFSSRFTDEYNDKIEKLNLVYYTELENKYKDNKLMLKFSQLYMYNTRIRHRIPTYYGQMLSNEIKTTQAIKRSIEISNKKLNEIVFNKKEINEKEINENLDKSILVKISNLTHILNKIFVNNIFVLFLAYIIIFYSFISLFFKKLTEDRFLVITFFSLHFLSTIIITILQARFLYRYSFVTDFSFYFILLISISYFPYIPIYNWFITKVKKLSVK